MENQDFVNSSGNNTVNQSPHQSQSASRNSPSLLLPIFITFLVSAIVFGFGGYYLGSLNSNNLDLSTNKQDSPDTYPTVAPSTNNNPSPSDSKAPVIRESWKKYTNSDYNYSVEIPETWEAIRQGGDNSVISIRPIGADNIPVVFNSQKNNDNLTLDEWVNNQLGDTYPREKRVLSGYNAIFVNNTTSPYEYNVFYLANDSIVYELSGSTLDKENLEIFNQIISTFKFIN